MKIDEGLKAKICRMFLVEKFTYNAIAAQLQLHHSTVKNAVRKKAQETTAPAQKFPESLENHRPRIKELLEQYPDLQGERLFEILTQHGVLTSANTCRRALKFLRHKIPKAYGKRQTLPGWEAQVDWAEKMVLIGNQKIKVYLFLMVLSYSRQMYVEVTQDMKAETFMWCHAKAFKHFGGVPKVILYDNLKAVVVERVGQAIRFSSSFLAFSSHYLFEPRACHVRTPEEKGRVERQVSVVKNNFFNGREFDDLQDLKFQLQKWLQDRLQKSHPENDQRTLESFFQEEQPFLLKQPPQELYPRQIKSVKIGKQPYAHFETNLYSLPPDQVQTTLRVGIGPEDLHFYRENTLVTTHPRCFEHNKILEKKEHLDLLLKSRNQHTKDIYKRGYLLNLIPDLQDFFMHVAQRQENLGPLVRRMEALLNLYGVEIFEKSAQRVRQEQNFNIDNLEMDLKMSASKSDKDFKKQIRRGLPSHLQKLTTKHHPLKNYQR